MTSKALAQPDMQARLKTYADGLAAAVVVSLPWSTSATNVLIVLWLVALIPTLQREDLRARSLLARRFAHALLYLRPGRGSGTLRRCRRRTGARGQQQHARQDGVFQHAARA